MPKRKVLVETISEFKVFGPDNTNGYVKVYRDYPVTAEFKNPKNSGGEIWDWAQANWPDFAPEEQEFEVGGSTITGTLRWACVRGVMDAKTKKSLPIAEVYVKKTKKRAAKKTTKKAQKATSSSPPGKGLRGKAKTPDKPGEFDELLVGADVDAVIGAKIQKAMGEEA